MSFSKISTLVVDRAFAGNHQDMEVEAVLEAHHGFLCFKKKNKQKILKHHFSKILKENGFKKNSI